MFEVFLYLAVISLISAQISPSLASGNLFKLVLSPFDTTLVVFGSFPIVWY